MTGFPKIHPRTRIVNAAAAKVTDAIDRAISELTYAEVSYILSEIQHSYARHAIKAERADEPDTAAAG